MKTLTEIKSILSQYKPVVQLKYKVSKLGIFGSYVRGGQTETSDVDVLIDYEEAPSLLKLIELEDLSQHLGTQVDLVTKNGLKPWLKERILAEVVDV